MRFTNYYKSAPMKRVAFILSSIMILSLTPGLAQNPNLEKLNAYKIAFLTKRIDLTSQEAEKFWPVYNEFQSRKFHLQQERALIGKTVNVNGSTMSEKELTDMGDKWIDLEVEEAFLAREFHNKVKTILPPIKVVRLYQAENQYRLQLLNELQDRRPVRLEPPLNRPGRN
jgi:hypothetical protein